MTSRATLLASYAEDDDNHMGLALQGRQYNNCQPRGAQFPRSRGYYCCTALDRDLPEHGASDPCRYCNLKNCRYRKVPRDTL